MESYGPIVYSRLNDWFNHHNVYTRFNRRTTSQRKRRKKNRK